MSIMDEREQIITIVFSIVGFLSLLIIIILSIWCLRLRRQSQFVAATTTHHRHEYQRAQKLSTSTNVIHNKHKRRKKRFNTNESAISFSFNPPHLINQNVKNLDQLFSTTDSPSHYEEQLPQHDTDRYYPNPTTEPVYTSSSSISTPVYAQHLNNFHFQFLNELNHALCSKQEQRPSHALKYSESYRQRTDLLPFDYYRPITPSLSSSNESFFDSTYRPKIYTGSNTALIHKASLGDDTAIFY